MDSVYARGSIKPGHTVTMAAVSGIALDLSFQETLVELRVVGLMESSRESEIRQLNVSITINQNVVGLDISVDIKTR